MSDNRIGDRERQRLRDHAARIRADDALGRSRALVDLFEFLLRCSLADRSPKEQEVGHEVFGRDADADSGHDASVRVYVHRLRRKLEEYYAANGAVDGRLHIPRGEYRLRVTTPADVPGENMAEGAPEGERVAEPAPAAAAQALQRRAWNWRIAAAALLLLLVLNGAAWLVFVRSRAADEPLAVARASSLWRPMLAGRRPTVVVLGDYYIFGESDSRVEISRLVREFSINSRQDLDDFLMGHPGDMGRYVDLDLSYLPVGAAAAIGDVLPVVKGRSPDQPVRVIPLSELTPEILSSSNILYIGLLSGLGPLRDPLFAASRLRIGGSYDELIDQASGRRFVSDWANRAGGMPSHRDYGYVASLPGPNRNHIVVIAGTRDPGLMQAARSAIDPAVLAALDRAAGDGQGVEGLFAVESMGNANLGGKLVLSGRIDGAKVWQNGGPRDMSFPEQPVAPDR